MTQAQRLAAIAKAEKMLPELLRAASNKYGVFRADQIFGCTRPKTQERRHARLDVIRRLCLAVPDLSNPQLGTLLDLNPQSVQRMRETIETMTFKGHEWKL